MIQVRSRFELRKKQAAARIKKGVVGRRGRNIPAVPKNTDRMPMQISRYWFNFFFAIAPPPLIPFIRLVLYSSQARQSYAAQAFRLTGILCTSQADHVRCSLISILRSYGGDLNGLYVSAKSSGRCIPGVCPRCVRKRFRRIIRITVYSESTSCNES